MYPASPLSYRGENILCIVTFKLGVNKHCMDIGVVQLEVDEELGSE